MYQQFFKYVFLSVSWKIEIDQMVILYASPNQRVTKIIEFVVDQVIIAYII